MDGNPQGSLRQGEDLTELSNYCSPVAHFLQPTMTVDLCLLDLETSEIRADIVTDSVTGFEVLGIRFGLNPRGQRGGWPSRSPIALCASKGSRAPSRAR